MTRQGVEETMAHVVFYVILASGIFCLVGAENYGTAGAIVGGLFGIISGGMIGFIGVNSKQENS
ncbi:MAG: hypothetical protein WC752_01440 [Patescibacteria group bacterium]|jgi:hypothetical protein